MIVGRCLVWCHKDREPHRAAAIKAGEAGSRRFKAAVQVGAAGATTATVCGAALSGQQPLAQPARGTTGDREPGIYRRDRVNAVDRIESASRGVG